jgi:hypothetical protein
MSKTIILPGFRAHEKHAGLAGKNLFEYVVSQANRKVLVLLIQVF